MTCCSAARRQNEVWKVAYWWQPRTGIIAWMTMANGMVEMERHSSVYLLPPRQKLQPKALTTGNEALTLVKSTRYIQKWQACKPRETTLILLWLTSDFDAQASCWLLIGAIERTERQWTNRKDQKRILARNVSFLWALHLHILNPQSLRSPTDTSMILVGNKSFRMSLPLAPNLAFIPLYCPSYDETRVIRSSHLIQNSTHTDSEDGRTDCCWLTHPSIVQSMNESIQSFRKCRQCPSATILEYPFISPWCVA
jgi:hypothetical protein